MPLQRLLVDTLLRRYRAFGKSELMTRARTRTDDAGDTSALRGQSGVALQKPAQSQENATWLTGPAVIEEFLPGRKFVAQRLAVTLSNMLSIGEMNFLGGQCVLNSTPKSPTDLSSGSFEAAVRRPSQPARGAEHRSARGAASRGFSHGRRTSSSSTSRFDFWKRALHLILNHLKTDRGKVHAKVI